MNIHLHIDFETRSRIDLKKAGLDVYAKDASTEVLCMAYAFGDAPVELLDFESEQPGFACFVEAHAPQVEKHVAAGGLVYAHNAAFELAIWNQIMVPRFGWPVLKPEQVRCTMAAGYAMGLPGALDNLAPALGSPYTKDPKGYRLMLAMCKPKKVTQGWTGRKCPACKGHGDCATCGNTGDEHGDIVEWREDEASLAGLYNYCKGDVLQERDVEQRMMALSKDEQNLWVVDQRINRRGIQVDIPAIKAAIQVVIYEKARLDAKIKIATGGAVEACTQAKALGEWIVAQGIDINGVAKADVLDALALDDLPDNVRAALLLRQEAAKSSTAKLVAILACVSTDGRVRYTKQYHGAATGRWAGRKVQPDNFPRGTLKPAQVAEIIGWLTTMGTKAFVDRVELFYGSPMDVLSSCLRGFIIPAAGHKLVTADFANIEGRVLAWLAGEQWKLDAFSAYDAGTGPDLYLLSYSKAFGVTIDAAKPFRQVGKVMELALGYQGGVGAFQTMARGYGVVVSDERADQLKVVWRKAHPIIQKYWYACEEAAIKAVLNPGEKFYAGAAGRQVCYRKVGSFLWCRLPNGRALCYPYPKLEPGKFGKDQLSYMYVDPKTKKWTRGATYGGSLVENITQAVARDVLADAIVGAEDMLMPVVMHVHDEIVVELPEDSNRGHEELCELMCVLPAWAAELPIAAEGWSGYRYRK